jgi:hypothetical protein
MELLDKVLKRLDPEDIEHTDPFDMYTFLETTGRYAWFLRDEADYWYLIHRVLVHDKDGESILNSMYVALGLNDWYYYDAKMSKDEIISDALDNGMRIYYTEEHNKIEVADYIKKHIENADDAMMKDEAELKANIEQAELKSEMQAKMVDELMKLFGYKPAKRHKPENWNEYVWE